MYPEADRIRDARNAAILAENARLRGDIVRLTGITLTQQQVDCALQLLPERLHADYLRSRELGVGANTNQGGIPA